MRLVIVCFDKVTLFTFFLYFYHQHVVKIFWRQGLTIFSPRDKGLCFLADAKAIS